MAMTALAVWVLITAHRYCQVGLEQYQGDCSLCWSLRGSGGFEPGLWSGNVLESRAVP